jgi:hypothetical protein
MTYVVLFGFARWCVGLARRNMVQNDTHPVWHRLQAESTATGFMRYDSASHGGMLAQKGMKVPKDHIQFAVGYMMTTGSSLGRTH